MAAQPHTKSKECWMTIEDILEPAMQTLGALDCADAHNSF
jgi:hypothetical protein